MAALRISAMILPLLTLAACHPATERDWKIGATCKGSRCYEVFERVRSRETGIWEGESSEKVLRKKIVVTSGDRLTGVRRQYPTIVCNDVSCFDHQVELLVCGAKVLPRDGRDDYVVENESAANFRCVNPISIGSFPQPLN